MKMRPLTETITSSGGVGGKKASRTLPDSGSVRANGKQQQQTSQSNATAISTTATPRRGTFSLQNGYGYPLNGYTKTCGSGISSNCSSFNNSSGGSSVQVSKHAKPLICSINMDTRTQQQEYNKLNGHDASNNMSPVLQTATTSSQSHNMGLAATEHIHPHHQQIPTNHTDIQYTTDSQDSLLQEDEFFLPERFYVHETPSPTDSQCTSLHSGAGSADEEDDHPFFAGMRDVRHPETLRELKIVSSKGTIRGVKNRVKAGIATFLKQGDEIKKKNYRGSEKGKIVIYTTSMMIVRDTHEKCKKVKNILQTHMVKYEERDIFMSRENQRELSERLENEGVDVPQVFADGRYLGGAEELEHFNESGELRRIFKHFKKISHGSSCDSCGGYRYIPCVVCHGSRKSVHRNHFTAEFCALRCIVCDENGLVKCDTCGEQLPESEKTKL